MTASGNTILYRYSLAGDDYRAVGFTDKIEMDLGVIPDATGHIKQSTWTGEVSLQENPQPTQNKPHDVQDLGISSFTVELVGFIDSPPTSLVATTLRTWFQEPKQNSNYPLGRFGIRTNDFPAFDSEPTTTYGYNLGHLQFVRPGDFPKIDLIISFKFNGAISGLGVQRT